MWFVRCNMAALKSIICIIKSLPVPVLDIDFATRKIAISLSQTKVITQNGDMFDIKTLSTLRNYERSFTVGVEYDEYTKGLDSRNIKVGRPLVCRVLEVTIVCDSLSDEAIFPFFCGLYDNVNGVIYVCQGKDRSLISGKSMQSTAGCRWDKINRD